MMQILGFRLAMAILCLTFKLKKNQKPIVFYTHKVAAYSSLKSAKLILLSEITLIC